MSKFDKHSLIGRDHTLGLLAFRTGRICTEKDKLRNRNSKLARKEKRQQLEFE